MKQKREILEISENMTFKDILFHIRLNGYGYIGFEYCGSGDDGSIDSIYLVPKECAEQKEDGSIELINCGLHELSEKATHFLSSNMERIIHDQIINHILDDAPDWYNNEGGGGNGYICTENGDFSTNHYYNVVETVDSLITGNLFN
jgi:hypothetical protein